MSQATTESNTTGCCCCVKDAQGKCPCGCDDVSRKAGPQSTAATDAFRRAQQEATLIWEQLI